MSYNDTWDVFDMFSKISVAIFRSLLESLGRNGGSSEDDFSLPRSFPLKKEPTVTNLIENTIKNLRSISNNNGYILIAIVPRNEGVLAVDFVTREVILVSLNIIINFIFYILIRILTYVCIIISPIDADFSE